MLGVLPVNSCPQVLLATIESDAHTWNLAYLELLLRELNGVVRNLGPCTPVDELKAVITSDRPDLVVISTVNGHGHAQARLLIAACRSVCGSATTFVIGGKLTTGSPNDEVVVADLQAAGFDQVFLESADIGSFISWFEEFRGLMYNRGKLLRSRGTGMWPRAARIRR